MDEDGQCADKDNDKKKINANRKTSSNDSIAENMEENNSDKIHPIINNNQFRAGKGSFSPTIPECQFFIATDDEQEQGETTTDQRPSPSTPAPTTLLQHDQKGQQVGATSVSAVVGQKSSKINNKNDSENGSTTNKTSSTSVASGGQTTTGSGNGRTGSGNNNNTTSTETFEQRKQ